LCRPVTISVCWFVSGCCLFVVAAAVAAAAAAAVVGFLSCVASCPVAAGCVLH
jgi:hypothetical protein